ncbi:hypothetical protein IWW36_002538 [Coemansia brasiliensis]|uniref:NAD(P)-binding protein n=1 Tax=Coemansia brasiliensis TaxID=2650707 RepID=A0A9W8I725_9FUNG|nr:hypothetical protein IWW36_002538 [Coemansia brasiliensis]
MVAVITGANSGVGLAIAKRLLAYDKSIVLACRNADRASSAQKQLISEFPNATIHIVQLDTSSTKSVLNAAYEISKLGPVDLLFCNAGAMAIAGLNLKAIAYGLFTKPIEFFESSDALVQQRGLLSKDGLGLTFQTNVFGHYLLIHKLLFASGARVIWTGSAASRLAFSRSDFMHIHGPQPYESSKFVIDQIAIPLDTRLSRDNVRCFVAEPGNVCSSFLAGLNIPLLNVLVMVVFVLMRLLGLRRFTISSECASASCMFLALAPESELDPRLKYYSCASRLGLPFVSTAPLDYIPDTADFLIKKLDSLMSRK